METLKTCLCMDATLPEACSHSARRRQEIEARNVCQWLCMAGFPQYVQMFQDSCGPFNLTQVEKDHHFLDAMSLKLLLSQIAYLNQLSSHKVSIELSKEELSAGSDGEDDHVLSDQWTCQTEGGRRWVHKFLPRSRIASGHQKLSRGGGSSSDDGATAASSKISNVKPLFRCLSSGPVPSTYCSNSEPLPVGHPKVRSSSLSGKGVKRSSFFTRENSNAAPHLSRDSSVSDSESLSEKSLDQSKFRSSFRNIFRRSGSGSGSRRGRNIAAGHGRPPNAPSVSKVDIGCPVFVGSLEIKEKMDKLNCVSVNSTAIQALAAAEIAESDVPACNNNFGSACGSGCTDDSCSVINGHQCAITADKHNSLGLSSILENGFRDESAVQNTSLKKNSESEIPVSNAVVENYSACALDANGLLCIQKKVGDRGAADDHLSVYDNLTDSSGDKSFANPQLELDLILAELYRNIESLNETLQDVENPYSGADSDNVFEEAAPSQICDNSDKDPPLSQHRHASELVISSTNGTAATNDCQNDFKPDCTCADADSRHLNAGNTTSGLNGGKRDDEDIPDSLSVWSNDAKYPSTVIPESVKCVKNVDGNSNGGAEDCSNDAKVDAVRLETFLQSPRWHSFSQDHRLSFRAECGNLSCMTSCQMALLYKLNLIKLTSILEKYVPSVPFSWFRNKSKPVSRCQQSSGVFGRSLLKNLQETGCPLPSWVILAMQRIRRCAAEAIGIFRKSGVRSRIQKFRDQIQSEPDSVNFESLQIYDVADLLKLYFRELPDCLLTRPLSQIFVSIFRNVPKNLQLEAIKACIVLMPDENREVLQCLLFLLLDLSAFANKNQMTASNLAICFAPSLFDVYGIREIPPKLSDKPAKHKGAKGGEGGSQKLTPPISQNEIQEQQAAQECLTFMISNAKELFLVSCDILEQCNVLQLDSLPFIHPFDNSSLEIYRAHMQLMIDDIIQESSENFKSWCSLLCLNNVELSYKKQEHPLRLWRCCVDVSASPQDVLTRIQRERHLWDRDSIDECIVDRLGMNIDVCRYTLSRTPPQMPRTFCVLRSWNTKLPNDACVLVSASIKHPESMAQDAICGTVFTSSYLIESLGKEKSRVIFISQVDLRGYSPRWYRKAYGYLCINLMTRLRDSLSAH